MNTPVEVIHEVLEAARTCACGTPMVVIGEEVSEQLDIVPMQVLRHVRKRYGCPPGEHAPVSAPAPAQVLPKSNASNDLLALLLTTKDVDGLALARFEYVLGRARRLRAGRSARPPPCSRSPTCCAMRCSTPTSSTWTRRRFRCSRSPGATRAPRARCGCSAAARRASRSSSSNTIRAAPRRCPCACSTTGRAT